MRIIGLGIEEFETKKSGEDIIILNLKLPTTEFSFNISRDKLSDEGELKIPMKIFISNGLEIKEGYLLLEKIIIERRSKLKIFGEKDGSNLNIYVIKLH